MKYIIYFGFLLVNLWGIGQVKFFVEPSVELKSNLSSYRLDQVLLKTYNLNEAFETRIKIPSLYRPLNLGIAFGVEMKNFDISLGYKTSFVSSVFEVVTNVSDSKKDGVSSFKTSNFQNKLEANISTYFGGSNDDQKFFLTFNLGAILTGNKFNMTNIENSELVFSDDQKIEINSYSSKINNPFLLIIGVGLARRIEYDSKYLFDLHFDFSFRKNSSIYFTNYTINHIDFTSGEERKYGYKVFRNNSSFSISLSRKLYLK